MELRAKVRATCEFMIESSTFAIAVLKCNSTDAEQKLKAAPANLNSLTNYLQYVVVPLI